MRRAGKIALFMAPLLVVLALGFKYIDGMSEPSTCRGCHDRQAIDISAGHGDLGCRQCHIPEQTKPERWLKNAVKIMPFWRPAPAAKFLSYSEDKCRDCHRRELKRTIVSNEIAVSHKEFLFRRSCTLCHSAGHRRRPSLAIDVCKQCHGNETASGACRLCHRGSVTAVVGGKLSLRPVHGKSVLKTHGSANLTLCQNCHQADFCRRCHVSVVPHPSAWVDGEESHGKAALVLDSDCYVCHDGTGFCRRCHSLDMPHPNNWLRNHATLANAKPKTCDNCHAKTDCQLCHRKHIHPGWGWRGRDPRVTEEEWLRPRWLK